MKYEVLTNEHNLFSKEFVELRFMNTFKKTYVNVNKAFLYYCGAALLLSAGCRSSRGDSGGSGAPATTFQQWPIAIDGLDNDWTKPLPYYDKGEKLNYAVTNDGENLYILFSTKDQVEQQKILQGGMTVWINPRAEKSYSQAMGIGFPLDIRDNRDRNLMAQARPDRYANKPVTIEDLKNYSLYGFGRTGSIENYAYGDPNPENVRVAINTKNTGELIYEAAIPLNALFPGKNPHFYAGRDIAVGFLMEGVLPPPGMDRDGGGGVSIGGGIGMGSFGSGGGVGVSIGSGSLGRIGGKKGSIYRPGKVWQVVTLAKAPS